MKFNLLVEELITKFAPNKGQETYAILPGGFKPPHKGHFNALNYLLEEADKGVVFIGKKERDGITAEQSKAIWDVYVKYLSKPVAVEIAAISPVNSAYDFVSQHPNSNVIVGVGPEEDPTELKRYDYFRKNTDKFPLVKIVNIPAMNNRISGTQTRSLIKSKDKHAIEYFVPTESQDGKDVSLLSTEDKNRIAKILKI
jgi:phosphopantetheine adenylyltransferase